MSKLLFQDVKSRRYRNGTAKLVEMTGLKSFILANINYVSYIVEIDVNVPSLTQRTICYRNKTKPREKHVMYFSYAVFVR